MVFTLFWCKSYIILVLWVGDGLIYNGLSCLSTTVLNIRSMNIFIYLFIFKVHINLDLHKGNFNWC